MTTVTRLSPKAILWGIGGILSFPLFSLNVMAFDSPASTESPGTYVWVLGLISIPILMVLGGIAAFVTRRAIFLSAPSIGFVAWFTGKVLESAAR